MKEFTIKTLAVIVIIIEIVSVAVVMVKWW